MLSTEASLLHPTEDFRPQFPDRWISPPPGIFSSPRHWSVRECGSDSAGVEKLVAGGAEVGLRVPGRQVRVIDRCPTARRQAAGGRLVDVLEPMTGRAAGAVVRRRRRRVPRHDAAVGGQLAVDGAGGAVRAPGVVAGGAARLARRATERPGLGVGVSRGHERREQLLLLATAGVSVEHLAERAWIVDVITAKVAVRSVTPFPASSSSSSSKQLAMAPLNRCSAAPYKQYSTYNVGYVYNVT